MLITKSIGSNICKYCCLKCLTSNLSEARSLSTLASFFSNRLRKSLRGLHSINSYPTFLQVQLSFSSTESQQMPKQKRSVKHNENICWIDLEMTGLDPQKDQILECACIITNSELEILDEMGPIVVHQPKQILDNMNDWCIEHHGKSGLTQKSLDSTISLSDAETTLEEFVSQYCPPKKCPIAGNSVGTDVAFLRAQMPKFCDCLHYRIVDVSSLKEVCRRWYPSIFSRAPKKKLSHRALDDIRESIEELKYYRANMFK